MTAVADPGRELFFETAAAPGLKLRLDTGLPPSLPVRRGTAIFCSGACFHRERAIRRLELVVDGVAHTPTAWRLPRLDLLQLAPGETRCLESGFWATLPLEARERPGAVELGLRVQLDDGGELRAPLGTIAIAGPHEPQSCRELADRTSHPLIAICLATFEPDMRLFRAQVESLRGQTDRNWICLISDDCSSVESFEQISSTVAGDPRFVVSRSRRNVGPYRNFERALAMVPREAELVALCDQDDRWSRDKLQVLRAALGPARLVYSDQRLVDAEGRVLRDTFWLGRRNNHANLSSLLIANSVTGAAALFRREVAELALPFPDPPGWQFHDHWIGLVALASGDVAYVDRPLYDYVQHERAIVGKTMTERAAPARSWRSFARGWRATYFYGYLAREVQAQALLSRCSAQLTSPKRRALTRFVASGRSPLAFAWLVARGLRPLVGANETLGTELELARGILWRWLVGIRALAVRGSPRLVADASCPPADAAVVGQNRLARWRARL